MTTRRRILIYLSAMLAGAAVLYLFLVAPRRARDPQRLLTCFPAGAYTTLYIDVQTLREAGVLDQLAGAAGAEEPDYRAFVAATGFNYRQDLDAVAIYFTPDARLIVARGRFDRAKLAAYAKAGGGRCAGELCTVEGSARDRQISWTPLDNDLLGIAVARDQLAAMVIGKAGRAPEPLPPAPVWLTLPGSALEDREGLPAGFSALLSSLNGASRATFVVNGSEQGFEIRLIAPFDDRLRAEASVKRLREATEALHTLLARAGTPVEKGSLAEALTQGSFMADGTRAQGRWNLGRDFLGGSAK